MTKYLLALVLALVAVGASPTAEAGRVLSTSQLAPTQTEFGADAAKNKLNKWVANAKAQGVSLETYAKTVLKEVFANAKVPVVVAPNGVVRTLDGHHKLSALIRLQKMTGVSVPVSVHIQKDYRGYSEAKYADHFVNSLGKGYFGDSPPSRSVHKVEPSVYAAVRW